MTNENPKTGKSMAEILTRSGRPYLSLAMLAVTGFVLLFACFMALCFRFDSILGIEFSGRIVVLSLGAAFSPAVLTLILARYNRGFSHSPLTKTCLKITFTAMGLSGVLVLLALWPISRARERGRDIQCRNCMGSLACAMSMYSMSRDEEFPLKIDGLYPDVISDHDIFRCCRYSGERGDGNEYGLEYLSGLNANCLPDSVLLFCKKSHRGEGRNVLYWPPKYTKVFGHYPGLVSEEEFQQDLRRMLNTPEYRKQYTPEAIKTMGTYLNTGNGSHE